MKLLYILPFALLMSCGGGSEEKKDEKSKDGDSTETNDTNTTETEEAVENPNETSIEEFEKENEGGMDFCTCVLKIKELDDKMIASETDAEMEAIMAEKDKLTDTDCKVLKIGGQESPEDRAARQQKTKACLAGK